MGASRQKEKEGRVLLKRHKTTFSLFLLFLLTYSHALSDLCTSETRGNLQNLFHHFELDPREKWYSIQVQRNIFEVGGLFSLSWQVAVSLTHLLFFIFLWGVTRITKLDICPIKQLGTLAKAGHLLSPRHRGVSACCSERTSACPPTVSRFAQHVCPGAQMPLTPQTEAQVSLSYQWKSVLCVPTHMLQYKKLTIKTFCI